MKINFVDEIKPQYPSWCLRKSKTLKFALLRWKIRRKIRAQVKRNKATLKAVLSNQARYMAAAEKPLQFSTPVDVLKIVRLGFIYNDPEQKEKIQLREKLWNELFRDIYNETKKH